jgi:hypothetical protein
MPSAVDVNGKVTQTPGVYGTINAEALNQAQTARGDLAIVGRFDFLEAATPLILRSPEDLRDLYDGDADALARVQIAFAPSLDTRVPGGASRVLLVGSATTTQAGAQIDDTDADPSVDVASLVWGTVGNRAQLVLTTQTDTQRVSVQVRRGSQTENLGALGSGVVIGFRYTGTYLSTAPLTVGPEQVLWTYTKAQVFPAAGGSQSIVQSSTEVRSASKVLAAKLVNGASGVSAANVTLTVVGLDEDGNAATDTWTAPAGTTNFGSGAGAYHDGDVLFSRIDSVTYATTDAAYNGTLTWKGTAFDLDTTEYGTLADVATAINAANAAKFFAYVKSPQLGQIPASPSASNDTGSGGLDEATFADAKSAQADTRANLWAFLEGVAASNLVSVTRATGATKPPALYGAAAATALTVNLVGGAVTAPDADAWQAAFDALLEETCQLVVTADTSLAVSLQAAAHAVTAAQNSRWRQVFVGAPTGTSLDDITADYIAALNSPYVALCGQEVQIFNSQAQRVWRDPSWAALVCAAMTAGTASPGTPITTKRPNILDFRADWGSSASDVEAMIAASVLGFSRTELGSAQVARGVTTYQATTNEALQEVSAWESCLESLRRLHAGLQAQIGDKVVAGKTQLVKGQAEALLQDQVDAGVIAAFRNVQVQQIGSLIRITYEFKAAFPLNFLLVTANLVSR